MKRLEDAIRNIRIWWYKRQGFFYDHSKSMWFKTRSVCCNATVHGVAMFRGKPLKKPFAQYSKEDKAEIYYSDWCDECHRKCKTTTEVVV